MLQTDTLIKKYFKEISSIPRGSYNETAISNYLVSIAKSLQLRYIQDAFNNVIIFKEASKGYEDHSPILLQAHMDMVCEKEWDSSHDFMKDPIELRVHKNTLRANGTTLGADDGCGVAYMLALLTDTSSQHPPLECVFTVQEEVGLIGATNLDCSVLKAKRMIGLDSGKEGVTCTTSSGGNDTILTYPIHRETKEGTAYTLSVDGLLGGHSGSCIALGRGNANILLARALKECMDAGIDIQLISIDGGFKDNAIPRESIASFISNSDVHTLMDVVENIERDMQIEYEYSDPGLLLELKEGKNAPCFTQEDSDTIINLLNSLPNGCFEMSQSIQNLPILSCNLGILKTDEDLVTIHYSIRSPLQSRRNSLSNKIKIIGEAFGAKYAKSNDYPGWEYDPTSKLRDQMKKVYHEIYGKELKENATHGGLETGVFRGKIPTLDIVTLGPDMQDIHTPEETLDLDSFERVYAFLVKFIATL